MHIVIYGLFLIVKLIKWSQMYVYATVWALKHKIVAENY